MIKIKVETLEKKSVQIFRMSTLDLHNKPVMWVSVFLIDGLLIDGGHHHARNELIKNLPFENIEYCVLSHHHEDHFGVCHYLIEKYNIPIYSNIATAFLVKMKDAPQPMVTKRRAKSALCCCFIESPRT